MPDLRRLVPCFGGFAVSILLAVLAPGAVTAQACPAGRACFYVPPAMPRHPTDTMGWDMVLASPRGTISGTWRAGAGAPTAFTVSPGTPLVVTLSDSLGTASAYEVTEARGIFIEASSPELIVDHRLSVGPWQSSSTIKNSAFNLGTRFRVAGYNLNRAGTADSGFDYIAVYAPFGGTVTFAAPTGAALPFWNASPLASFSVTLTPGQTYIARTIRGDVCTREIDAALVTSTDPITVDSGGRGWNQLCTAPSGFCGDDGADNIVPTSGLGTQFVIVDFPTAADEGEDVLVVADADGTEVRVNGTLVATLAAGGTHIFTLGGAITYVETSRPAYVFETTGLSACEIDLALIPAIALAPVGSWVVDFNVPAGFAAQIGVVLATTTLASLRVDGAVPTFITSGAVPGRPDLSAVRIAVSAGNHSVSAGADFQMGLVTAGSGTGLFGYYTPFRIPGCGDGVRLAPEGCDDGGLVDGDGCSSSCRIEIGFTMCTVSGDCVPAGRCDAGTCVARCFTSAECNDTNPCTTDICSGTGACSNTAVAAGSPGGCAAGLICTGAPLNACVACIDDTNCSAALPTCDLATNTCVRCSRDAQCDDMNDCTADRCTAGVCGNAAVMDGTSCATGRCSMAACTTRCGDTIVSAGIEECDDGNMAPLDGCSATCTVETGWACGCGMPIITYSMEAFAGRVGGDGGGLGPEQGCTGADVLIGLAIDWSDGRDEGVRTTTLCGSVSVALDGTVTTTPTTRETSGGAGCGGWDPSTRSADVVCPSGWAITGMHGNQSMLSGTPTLFRTLSIDCRQLGADGSAFGPTMTLDIAGGGTGGTPQDVTCPDGAIARFFRTRSGCAQDALDLFCGVASAACGGSASICATRCGDGTVGAPIETCDGPGETTTCDADCTAAMCGDGTVNTTAGETCDGSGETATCDANCTAAMCGDGTRNVMAGESCDDGNTTAGDGCSATCVSETCGDGMVQGTESCDTAGESASCDDDCTPAMCGDTNVNAAASETCDTGGESATCDADCTAPRCGDGVRNVVAGEMCDDGNTMGGDGCSATCVPDAMADVGPRDVGAADVGGPDAGPTEYGVTGGACGCRVGGGDGPAGLSLLGLVIALLLRRRARPAAAASRGARRAS